jgi:hypothetical protein
MASVIFDVSHILLSNRFIGWHESYGSCRKQQKPLQEKILEGFCFSISPLGQTKALITSPRLVPLSTSVERGR